MRAAVAQGALERPRGAGRLKRTLHRQPVQYDFFVLCDLADRIRRAADTIR